VSALLLVSTMATAGCGSDSSSEGTGGTGGTTSATGGSSGCTGGGSGEPVTTVSGCKALNALTEEEFTQLCNDTYAYFGNGISAETTCKWKGVAFATSSSAPTVEQLQENCRTKESSCLADAAAVWSNNPGCNEFPEDCTATVAQWATCIQDETTNFNQQVSGLPGCDSFTKDYWDPVWAISSAELLPSCSFCASLYPPAPQTP
jgi:hypothetical protein